MGVILLEHGVGRVFEPVLSRPGDEGVVVFQDDDDRVGFGEFTIFDNHGSSHGGCAEAKFVGRIRRSATAEKHHAQHEQGGDPEVQGAPGSR